MGKIYTQEGWLNAPWLYDECDGILRIVGARGTGKSYGFLKEIIERQATFMYLRRTDRQLEMCLDPQSEGGNPFKPLNDDFGWTIAPAMKNKKMYFFNMVWNEERQRMEPDGPALGVGASLSTLGNIRSADFSGVDVILFDEFIADVGDRPIKNEFSKFLNLIETVNRNRELKHQKSVKVIMLGNANKLANPYFVHWHLMKPVLHMITGGQMMLRDKSGTAITVLLLNSPISAKKSKTMLYQNAESDFVQMALNNVFKTDSTQIKSHRLAECEHVVSVGDVGIYRLKSSGLYYVSETVSKNNFFEDYGIYLKKFQNQYRLFRDLYMRDLIVFENFEVELIFREYLNL